MAVLPRITTEELELFHLAQQLLQIPAVEQEHAVDLERALGR